MKYETDRRVCQCMEMVSSTNERLLGRVESCVSKGYVPARQACPLVKLDHSSMVELSPLSDWFWVQFPVLRHKQKSWRVDSRKFPNPAPFGEGRVGEAASRTNPT